MFRNYDHLGFNNPYYFNNTDGFVIAEKFHEILGKYGEKRIIDPVAVIELLTNGYIFGDRSIIQGINKTPWLARPNSTLNKWEFATVAKHGELDINEEEIADYLFDKICNEILSYTEKKRTIGILLSGGMDSRIVAGTLDFLIKTGRLKNIDVTALTWGNEESRDVNYGKEIAFRLNWKWKHYSITENNLLNNIYETALRGCEYSPINLHAIPQIKNDNELDVILAGTYGDSIGRGEYSRKKYKNLTPINRDIENIMGLVNNLIYEEYKDHVAEDIIRYHDLFPEKLSYMQYELDYQQHYLRRMLNACMGVLSEKIEVCQVFTHPYIYNYVFPIGHQRRNDLVYKFLLQKFRTTLDDIPWARTGLPFGQSRGKPDNLSKETVSYIRLIKNGIYDYILEQINSYEIRNIGIFDNKSVNRLTYFIKYLPTNTLYYFDKLVWLSSVAEMIKIYNIQGLSYSIFRKKNKVKSSSMRLYEYIMNLAKIKLYWLLK